MVTIKSRREIDKMRQAGRIVAEVLALVETQLKPGVTTAELDGWPSGTSVPRGRFRRSRTISAAGATENGPRPSPAASARRSTSEVVHGIPDDRALRAGQIISIDAGAIYDGWHGDGARTFVIGDAPDDVRRLVDTTRLAIMAGIAAARPGNLVGDISAAVEDVAAPAGFGIVRQYVGHGIGSEMHQDPQVANFRTRRLAAWPLEPGMCLAIEPMLTAGSHEVETKPDGWTVVTRDGRLAAHFEHTIAVTETGPEILTTV